jgi:hypothetical protein
VKIMSWVVPTPASMGWTHRINSASRLAGFFRAARELQERHLARVQDLPRPNDLIS